MIRGSAAVPTHNGQEQVKVLHGTTHVLVKWAHLWDELLQ